MWGISSRFLLGQKSFFFRKQRLHEKPGRKKECGKGGLLSSSELAVRGRVLLMGAPANVGQINLN
jgi:hypothetical protein